MGERPVTRVVLVAARARNGVIGATGGIPWRIPADFAHFRRTTVGHPLVLGRATFEGIGRPLPDRQSIVVTSDRGWAHEGVLVARSFEEALEVGPAWTRSSTSAAAVGLYAEAIRFATEQVLTEVDLAPEGDTHYPDFDEGDWAETRREEHLDDDPAWTIRWLERR